MANEKRGLVDITTGVEVLDADARYANKSLTNVYLSTGILTGGVLSVNADNTKFDITDGAGYIVDNWTNPSSPVVTYVTWTGKTGITDDYRTSAGATTVLINSAGAVIQQNTPPTSEQYRDYIIIGKTIHPNKTTLVGANQYQHSIPSSTLLANDILDFQGIEATGVTFTANGANLNINRAAGAFLRCGANYATSNKIPNVVSLGAATPATFSYRYRNGSGGFTTDASTTTIRPSIWDDGSGTLQTPSSNKYTNQRVYVFSNGNTFIVPGQTLYNSASSAVAAVQTETVVVDPQLVDANLRCVITMKEGITDLSNLTYCIFTNGGLFGVLQGTAGGSSAIIPGGVPYDIQYNNNGSLGGASITGLVKAQGASAAPTAAIDGTDYLSPTTGLPMTTVQAIQIPTGIAWGDRSAFKVTAAYNSGTNKIDVALAFTSAGPAYYYIKGTKYTISSLPGTYTASVTPADGVWYVFINASNVFTVTQNPWVINDSHVLLFNFRYSSVNKSVEDIGEERHTAGRDVYQHARNHFQGAIYRSGLTFSSYNGLTTLSSNTDNNFGRGQLQIASGGFFDEDIELNVTNDTTAAVLNSSTASPAYDWALNISQYLGFTDIAANGTTGTTVVFPTTRTLKAGQALTLMQGNTTTVRATAIVSTGGTGTSFTVTIITGSGIAQGDAIVVGARIPIYYIDNVTNGVYRWRKLPATSFLGVNAVATQNWTRSGATITVTSAAHGFVTGDTIAVDVTSDAAAVPLGNYTVTFISTSQFSFTGLNGGASNGTLSYVTAFTATGAPNFPAYYNNTAGGLTAMSTNRYYPVYLLATNSISSPVIAILGQGQSTNATLTTALSEASFQFQNLVGLSYLGLQEMVPFYRITYLYNSGGAFTNSRIKVYDATYINVRVSTSSGTVIGGSTTSLGAGQVLTDVTNFNGNLTSADTTVQLALNTLSALSVAPASHTHGNITNAGAIGSTTNLPVVTTTSGALTVGSVAAPITMTAGVFSLTTTEQWVSSKPGPTSTGIKGQMYYASGYMYTCVDANIWVRQPVEFSGWTA